MRKILVIFSILTLLTGFDCGFNMGTYKDLQTGMSIDNNILGYENYTLTIDNQNITTNQIPYGKTIELSIDGVTGFTDDKGFVYPGASMIVKDPKGQIVFEEPDLFSDINATGASPEDASVITLSLVIGDPILAGRDYTWQTHIWDKSGQGFIDTSMEISVKK